MNKERCVFPGHGTFQLLYVHDNIKTIWSQWYCEIDTAKRRQLNLEKTFLATDVGRSPTCRNEKNLWIFEAIFHDRKEGEWKMNICGLSVASYLYFSHFHFSFSISRAQSIKPWIPNRNVFPSAASFPVLLLKTKRVRAESDALSSPRASALIQNVLEDFNNKTKPTDVLLFYLGERDSLSSGLSHLYSTAVNNWLLI